jgi:aspartyl aminopeptidase
VDYMNISKKLIDFIAQSPTPFHATQNLGELLVRHGFTQLLETRPWKLQKGEAYFFTRADSSIVAFIVGRLDASEHGIRLVGAHTDSPCLKVKPQPEKNILGYFQLGIEVYGGVLLNPWFDRDLSLAGKVTYLDGDNNVCSTLIDFVRPIGVVPSLAIHLDREANDKRSVNAQADMNVILFQSSEKPSLRDLLLEKLHSDGLGDACAVLDFNLSFYDVQVPAIIGYQQDFIASARLDNLLSSFVSINALTQAPRDYTSVVVCNDHEEIGSRSDIGAQGTMLTDLLARLIPSEEQRQITLRRSLMLSVDNAHGVHPNFVAKHDDNHNPRLNLGPVLKFDANQCYATSSDSAAFVRKLAKTPVASEAADIPLQTYVTRSDMRCGSTIGPITASELGVKTVDIGVPTFAMHSIRELAGEKDVASLNLLLARFYASASVSLA